MVCEVFSVIAMAALQAGAGGEWESRAAVALDPGLARDLFAWESLPDLSGDGISALVYLSYSSAGPELCCVDGNVRWTLSWRSIHNEASHVLPSWMERLPDVDGDSYPDLLVGGSSAQAAGVVALVSGVNGDVVWAESLPGLYEGLGSSGSRVGDIDQDGVRDFVVVARVNLLSGSPAIRAYSGASGGVLWEAETLSRGWGVPVAVGDLDGHDYDSDGCADFLLDSGGELRIVSARSGDEVLSFGSHGSLSIRGSHGTAVIEDLDGDQLGEVVVATYQYPAAQRICLSTKTRAPIWSTVDAKPYSEESATIPDQDGDLVRDLVFGVPELTSGGTPDGGKLALVSGVTGQLIRYVRGGGRNTEGEELGQFLGASPDDPDQLLAYQFLGPNGAVGSTIQFKFDPYIAASAEHVSAASAIAVDLTLSFPVEDAGLAYAALFSWSGFGPSTVGGKAVPLTGDGLLHSSLNGTLPGVILHPRGDLDAQAMAVVSVRVPPGVVTPLVGRTLHCAAVSVDLSAAEVIRSSAGVGIEILP